MQQIPGIQQSCSNCHCTRRADGNNATSQQKVACCVSAIAVCLVLGETGYCVYHVITTRSASAAWVWSPAATYPPSNYCRPPTLSRKEHQIWQLGCIPYQDARKLPPRHRCQSAGTTSRPSPAPPGRHTSLTWELQELTYDGCHA
jgi:hypothetical protein